MKKIFLAAFVVISSIITHAQTAEEKLNNKYCTGLFKSTKGTIYDLENGGAGGYVNILDWLDGRVAGLRVRTLKNGTKMALIRGQQASIYVDESQVNANYLNSLPTSNIAMIKVFKSDFFGGFNDKAIAIYTIGAAADGD
jgi:hypothetical protein